jgi:hypothetical protein
MKSITTQGDRLTASDYSSWAQTALLLMSLIATVWISFTNLRKADAAERRAQADSEVFADALDGIAQSIKGIALSAAAPNAGVRWALTWEGRSIFRIENIGDESAYNVRVVSHESLPIRGLDEETIEVVQPGEGPQFTAIRTFGTQDATITILWADDAGAEHKWARTLPFGT